MGNRHWVKLWINALDDARIATLDDTCWRLAVECFMVAGEHGDDGKLPSNLELSWRLRRNQGEMETLLATLEECGIVKKIKTGYKVAKFKKRQSAVTNALRQQAYRVTNRYATSNGPGLRQDKSTDKRRSKRRSNNVTTTPKKRTRHIGNLK